MALKKYKPTTPGRRDMSVVDYSELTKKAPEKRLLVSMKNAAGRNSQGKITVRHRGGGHKKHYRIIDFKRSDKLGIIGNVAAIEYDPNRTVFIALVVYPDGDKRYILAGEGMKVGDQVVCNDKAKVKPGNRMLITNIPEGFEIYNVEVNPGRGGQLVRSAGMAAKLVTLEGKYAQVQLPSGEIRYISKKSYATVGRLGNADQINVTIGKAGRTRWKRRRPQVRGKAMNPCDHMHGGGEGAQPIGLKHPKTPWGKPALGFKTRKRKSTSNMIVRNRKGK